MKMRAISFSLALCGSLLSAQPCLVSSNHLYTDARTGLTILGGTVSLPKTGLWELTRDLRGTGLSEIRLLPPAAVLGRAEGARLANDATVEYRLLARRSGDFEAPVTLTLHDRFSDRRLEVRWAPDQPQPGERELLVDWARLRMGEWRVMGDPAAATILGCWLRQAPELYGVEPVASDNRRPGNEGNQTTVFNVVGGRAAIQETLQLTAIGGPEMIRMDDPATVPVAQIPGVQVKAHDYAAMLGTSEGGRIPLADLVPADRLFAWFPRPAVLVQFLDAGTDFLFGLSSSVTGSSLGYQLTDRYLARLGLNEPLMRALLESGALTEVAIVLPDLHFIDGTDLTVIARTGQPALVTGALKLLGMGDLTDLTTRELPGGDTVCWLRQDDLLLVSSHRDELEQILELARREGADSLGQSAEFRYMLTQLEPRDTTRAFVYLSDPFIRRVTGPAAKIGQLRRLTARAQMEALTAGALLYGLDHDGARTTVEALFDQGYVPRIGGFEPSLFALDEQWVAHSETFGRPARMKTLLDLPVDRVTPREAKAYATYRENYERFWRQFFDPIAIRLDQTQPDCWELETFILPLIDSSIYNSLRRGVATAESRVPLTVPVLEPKPVAMLSANLTDEAWVEALEDMDDLLEPVLGRQSPVLHQLGPGLHFAVGDSDPVLSLGSGDLLGIFGGAGAGMNDDLFFIPAAVSLFTRPSALLIELKEPQAVIRELARLSTGMTRFEPGLMGLTTTLYRVTGEEAWVYSISLGGVMKLRFGLNVQGQYLVISNQPLTYRPRVLARHPAPNNGLRLGLQPDAVEKLGPSLRIAAMEQQREAARSGCGLLYPLLLSGVAKADEAARRHQAWFGFAPLHPPGGTFEWREGMVLSTVFGRPGAEQQPAFDLEDNEAGLLPHVRELSVSLQFEQDGLRVISSWSL
ncbi:MAG: hypothetical protein KJ072_16700 [Verrucomicrobia bacterium]|nr:hypothetical protein [Verrucomicrobiota bacterium]